MTWSNLMALRTLPWWSPNELVESDLRGADIGCVRADGVVAFASLNAALLQGVWTSMIGRLPELPWDEIRILIGEREWPRAISVPGAIIVSPAFPVNSTTFVLLYLVHELVHQWIGGVIAAPTESREHRSMEALVDACAWRFVESALPSVSIVFADLYRRYEKSSLLCQHARGVFRSYRMLDNQGVSRLGDLLEQATDGLRRGERSTFDLTALQG